MYIQYILCILCESINREKCTVQYPGTVVYSNIYSGTVLVLKKTVSFVRDAVMMI